MELQLKEAQDNNNIEKCQELMHLEYLLRDFLVEVLFEFGDDLQGYLEYPSDPKEIEHLVNCEAFKRLGCILYDEKPIIITFNYDDFIERAIEYASGVRLSDYATTNKFEDSDQELGYSYWNWNRALGYGIKFDEVMLYYRSEGTKQKHFEGSKFYSHLENTLYPWYLLKLHGSSNWFQFLPYTPNLYLNEDKEELSERVWERHGKIVLSERDRVFLHPPVLHDLYIEPIIITPIIHKEKHFDDPLYSKLLKPIWDKGKDSLTNCKRLVVIGYSFPATDFLTKKMFLESFSSNTLDELIIISPSQESINKVKDLCHFEEPKTFRNLDEYIEHYDKNI